jgi:hypothetical protein
MPVIEKEKDMKTICGLFVTFLLGATALPVLASDHGCEVLLCLANPAGPMAVGECVPPIKKLYKDLAHGRAFPSCAMSSGSNGPSSSQVATTAYAEPMATKYDQCPSGTSPAQQGAYVADGYLIAEGEQQGQIAVNGGGGVSQPNDCAGEAGCSSNYNGSARACVGDYLGNVNGAEVYGSVVWQQPSAPNTIRVVVDGTVYQNVTW